MSPVAFDTLPPGANRIVSQWRHLASVDEQSPDFGPLLSSLTAQDTRSLTVKLCRADAKATLNIMDQASTTSSARAAPHVASSTLRF